MYADMLNAMGVSTNELNKAVLNEDTWPVSYDRLRFYPSPSYYQFRVRDDVDAEELADKTKPWPVWDLYSHRTFGNNHDVPEDPEELVTRMAAAIPKQPKLRRYLARDVLQRYYICLRLKALAYV